MEAVSHVRGKKVFVGLSGGVDSSVAASRLVQSGALVSGVFIKGWYPEGMPCTWANDRRDAMRVAARLHIPFYTLDASAEYKREVIDYLLAEYRSGRTPNPDVLCNREVKFGAFDRFAMERGADYIATGHYARTGNGKLFKSRNAAKDQSYFLWAVPSAVLAHTLFPVGDEDKASVRREAERAGLPTARKADSQGVCFLGDVSIADFLRAEFGATRGVAKTEDGTAIGFHSGAIEYTLGERVALSEASMPGPWYVSSKDIEKNEICVTHEARPLPSASGSTLHFSHEAFRTPFSGACIAQYRYHGSEVAGMLTHARFIVSGPLPEYCAPGQSVVFYVGDECIGGGIMESCSQEGSG